MAATAKAIQKFRITITRPISRRAAERTLERLFMQDRAVAGPIEARSANFEDKPKRRGGRIWTKRPNKVHPVLTVGKSAVLPATAQFKRDLASVADFVEVVNA